MNRIEFERRQDELLGLHSMIREAVERYNELVNDAAEACGARPSVIKKAIAAINGDKASQVADDCEHLALVLSKPKKGKRRK